MRTTHQKTSMRFRFFHAPALFLPKKLIKSYGFSGSVNGTDFGFCQCKWAFTLNFARQTNISSKHLSCFFSSSAQDLPTVSMKPKDVPTVSQGPPPAPTKKGRGVSGRSFSLRRSFTRDHGNDSKSRPPLQKAVSMPQPGHAIRQQSIDWDTEDSRQYLKIDVKYITDGEASVAFHFVFIIRGGNWGSGLTPDPTVLSWRCMISTDGNQYS